MATFTFRKADPNDPRDICVEIEDASGLLAQAFNCRADIVAWSQDDEPTTWVQVELHGAADIDAAGNWFFGELSRRGVVVLPQTSQDMPETQMRQVA